MILCVYLLIKKSVSPDCHFLSSCQVLLLLSQMSRAKILLCTCLSKLSHYQFITSVSVAEVLFKMCHVKTISFSIRLLISQTT